MLLLLPAMGDCCSLALSLLVYICIIPAAHQLQLYLAGTLKNTQAALCLAALCSQNASTEALISAAELACAGSRTF